MVALVNAISIGPEELQVISSRLLTSELDLLAPFFVTARSTEHFLECELLAIITPRM